MQPSPLSISKSSSSSQTETLHSSNSNSSIPSSLPAPVTTILSMDVTILDISYKWNHIISGIPLCLAYHSAWYFHVSTILEPHSFWRLNNTPIVCIYHIPFIHLSVSGHLGYFHLWTTVNNAAMNISTQISVQVLAFSAIRYLSRNEVTVPYGSSIFKFLSTLHTIFHNGCIILPSYQQCWMMFLPS